MSDTLPPTRLRSIVGGVALAIGINILAFILFAIIILASMNSSDKLISNITGSFYYAITRFPLIGLLQLLYLVPMIRILRGRGHSGLSKGLIIGGTVTFLLSSACWALLVRPLYPL